MTAKPFGVLFGAESLLGRRSGIGRYTIEIARMLREDPRIRTLGLAMDHKIVAPAILDLLPEYIDCPEGSSSSAPRERGLVRQLRDTQFAQGVYALKQHYQSRAYIQTMRRRSNNRLVYHEPNMIPSFFDYPTVTTIHDLSWMHHKDLHPKERIDWIERNLTRTLDKTTRFVAVSCFTAEEFSQAFGVEKHRIDVIPNAPSGIFTPIAAEDAAPILNRYSLTDRGYILSASTLEPRKNFDRLLRAHSTLPSALRQRFPLVIVGGSGWGRTLDCPAAAEACRGGSLRLLGHVSDRDLAVLYARAVVFAYVSLYEGFGLPVIEAMAAGTPVIASSTTGTAETAADAAMLVDPTDEIAISSCLQTLIGDPRQAEALRAQGLERAACFTWKRTVESLMSTWQVALGDRADTRQNVRSGLEQPPLRWKSINHA